MTLSYGLGFMTVPAVQKGQLDLSAIQDELVLVLDFGGQTAQLIARRVRDQNVFVMICQSSESRN